MAALLIGYARVSTDEQDLTAQREALAALGVSADRIYVDHGLTGTNRDRPGLREALAVCCEGDTLVVTKLDRLARSLPDARDIVDELTHRHVKLSLGGSLHDPNDPVGRLLFNVLAMVAEFEADLIKMRTREGMRVAEAKGRLRGKQPKLNSREEAHLVAPSNATSDASRRRAAGGPRPKRRSGSRSASGRCVQAIAALAHELQTRSVVCRRSVCRPVRRLCRSRALEITDALGPADRDCRRDLACPPRAWSRASWFCDLERVRSRSRAGP